MANFCPECGVNRRQSAQYCFNCGYAFRHGSSTQVQLSSFDPMRTFSALMTNQQEWLRQNTLLEPLQELIDNVRVRTAIDQATHVQSEQVLTGYQSYTSEQIELIIDQVRNARRMADAETALEILRRNAQIDDAMSEREHQRRLEQLRLEHRHQEKMMELRAQLELVNAMIQSFNRLQLITLEAEAQGQADEQQIQMLTRVIRQSFTALSEIDAGQIEYARRIKELDFENLEDARSYQLLDELVQAFTDRLMKGVVEFGEQSRTNPGTRFGT